MPETSSPPRLAWIDTLRTMMIVLVAFCVVFAGWRAFRPQTVSAHRPPAAAPSAGTLLGFATLLILTTFLVRIVQPIGGPLLLAGVVVAGGPPPENGPNPYAGGWNVRAFALATWEQLAGLGIALGLIASFLVADAALRVPGLRKIL